MCWETPYAWSENSPICARSGDRGVAEHARQLGERQEQLKRLGIEARAAGDAYARLGEMQRGLDMQVRGLQRLEQASRNAIG